MSQPLHNDPGLQPERTDLAWRRTGYSMTVVALLGLRWVTTNGELVLMLTGIGGLAALTVFATAGRRYRAQSLALAQDRSPASPGTVLATLGAVTLLSAVALAVAVLA